MPQEKNFSCEERFLRRIRAEQFRADGPGAFGGPGARTVIPHGVLSDATGGDRRRKAAARLPADLIVPFKHQGASNCREALNETGGSRTRRAGWVPGQY